MNQHPFWRRIPGVQRPEYLAVSSLAALALLAVYALGAVFAPLTPGNAWGLAYGSAATLLLLAVTLLGVRRRAQRWGPGRVQDWVQFHVYGGTLFMLLVLLHSGFRWPQGVLTLWLWILSVAVTLSGLLGVLIGKTIPRILTSGLRTEVLYERIPELTTALRTKAEDLAQGSSPPIQDFYRKELAPALRCPQVRLLFLLDITGGIQERLRAFEFLRHLLSPDEQARCDELQDLYRIKLELDAHYTLQRPLRFWLYGHVPLAIVLLVLVAIHLVAVFYY